MFFFESKIERMIKITNFAGGKVIHIQKKKNIISNI